MIVHLFYVKEVTTKMSVNFSCKDCVPPVRHVGCHSTCEKYIAEKNNNDKRLEEEHMKSASRIRTNSNGTYFKGKRGSNRV